MSDHPDAELYARARAGEAAAFAALLHRHAPALFGAAAGDADRVRRGVLRAVRRLRRDSPDDVGTWLVDQVGGERPDLPDPVPASDVDELWSEVAARWPRGRRPLRLPRPVGQAALVLVLLALAVVIPTVLLLTASPPRQAVPAPSVELVAEPVDDADDPTQDPPAGP